MYKADVNVTGSRRHVDKKEIKLAPANLKNHLLKRIASHCTSPDKSLLRSCKVADRHPLHAIFLHRHDRLFLSLLESLRHCTLGCRHLRNGRTVDVSIGKSYLVTKACKSDCEVDSHSRLAYAALSGSDTDDMLYILHLLETKVKARLLLRCRVLDDSLDFNLSACSGISDDACLCTSDEVFCERVAVLREAEGHSDASISDLDILHHSQLDDILVSLCGVLHFLEPFHYFVYHLT